MSAFATGGEPTLQRSRRRSEAPGARCIEACRRRSNTRVFSAWCGARTSSLRARLRALRCRSATGRQLRYAASLRGMEASWYRS